MLLSIANGIYHVSPVHLKVVTHLHGVTKVR